MPSMRTRVAAAALIGVVGSVGWWWSQPAPQADLPWFSNRIWAERMPADSRDQVQYFTPVKVGKKQFGVLQRQSNYRLTADRFEWTLSGDTLALGFPQDQRKVAVKARSWVCKGEAPKPFDLCLELSHGKETVTLYSRRHWVVPRESETPLEIPFSGEVLPLEDEACAACVDGLPDVLQQLGL